MANTITTRQATRTLNAQPSGLLGMWKFLSQDRTPPEKTKMTGRELSNLLNMLSTLLDNGMPLEKCLLALSSDPSLRKHKKLLRRLHNRLVEGTSLHQCMAVYPKAFPMAVVQQVKLGEHSGNLSDSLRRIVKQIESWLTIKQSLFQKLSYPALVILAGSGLMTFMLTTVVPQFETIYAESKVSLPWVTSVVTGLSRTLMQNLWLPLLPIFAIILTWLRVRASNKARRRFDHFITRIPLVGSFIRDIAILQFIRSVHALSEAGFVPIDAITGACATVNNRYVRARLQRMADVLVHGTKLSVAMDALDDLIPGSVRQLIMVGEHSGNITKACDGACDFLQNRLQRRINGAMGMIEPLLTVGLATCIGWIVLAMYMPMFKMFDVLDF